MKRLLKTLLVLATFTINSAIADDVSIVDATANKTGGNQYSFSVTLKHADTGWDHYANEWQVLSPDGKVLGTRTLYHPHVDEQPFTRSLSGVAIPADIKEVMIRARDSKHGYNKQEFRLKLSE